MPMLWTVVERYLHEPLARDKGDLSPRYRLKINDYFIFLFIDFPNGCT